MFDALFQEIEKWMRELLTGMVNSNLTNMFTDVNEKTGEIAAQVGQTPQGWNGNIFSMIRSLSNSVIIPIAGMIITFVLCYELISMITSSNNMHEVDTFMFFKYFFKMWVAVFIVSHTFDLVMAIFDVGQHVVNGAAGVIGGSATIDISGALTTTATAIFVPFTTQELFMSGSESLYYGLNAVSNNMILADRKQLKNPNGLILGTPGSGKSFSAKREITNAFFATNDDIIICDPEGEYYPLVNALHGQVIHIAPNSHDYINPMDINLDYSDDDNPLAFKSDFVMSLCELIMGSRNGISAAEKTVIDRCMPYVYQRYMDDPQPENMPVLGDLYDCLRRQTEEEAQRIATALEIYVNGSLNVFNHHTNVQLENRIVCFDIKDLGKQLKKLGMLIVQDQTWNRVTVNRYAHKSTRYYIDEFHLLLKEEQTAAYSVEIWKRFRKWGGIPSGITQNVKDLLSSREIENIFENSDFILMLNQAAGDRQILAKQLNISPRQLSHVTNSGEGEGLLFFGSIIIPFKDKFDKSTKLYSLMTTKPEEVEQRIKREKQHELEEGV